MTWRLFLTTLLVAPARERGLKCQFQMMVNQLSSRSREGAWIEINSAAAYNGKLGVAPARERGLKSRQYGSAKRLKGRSREGAWIEILRWFVFVLPAVVAPARERGLKLEAGE